MGGGVSRIVSSLLCAALLQPTLKHGTATAHASHTAVTASSLITYGSTRQSILKRGQTVRIFDWNVHKFTNPKALLAVAQYSQKADIVVLQETMIGGDYAAFFKSLGQSHRHLKWWNAKSWSVSSSVWTGVATGVDFFVHRASSIKSNAREPILHTSKMIMVTESPIEGSDETLMIANIHAINFVSTSQFETHIRQLENAIQNHKGPLIVTGDFNTHWPARGRILNSLMERLGLQHVSLRHDSRFLRLDHLFVRGLKVKVAELLQQPGSDHLPLWAELVIE